MVRRRRFLLGLAAAATVAGCTDASTSSSPDAGEDGTATDGSGAAQTTTAEPTPTPADDISVADDGAYTVDVRGSSDGSLSITDTGIEFTAPVEMTWRLRGFDDGVPVNVGSGSAGSSSASDTPSGPPLSVGPRLDPTDDAQHGFATPVYDADTDRFELWFYVDETYRTEHEEHYVVWGPQRTMDVNSREATFTERADGVYRATVTYDRPVNEDMDFPIGVLLDRPYSAVTPASDSRPQYTAVGVTPRVDTVSTRTPQISFGFEYHESAGTVTITHEAGDTVQGSNLRIRVGGEPASTGFSGAVQAGDSVTVDVADAGSGTEIRVIWESPDGDAAATLATFELP